MKPMSYRELKEALVEELQSVNWSALNVDDLISVKDNLKKLYNINFDEDEHSLHLQKDFMQWKA